MEWECRSQRGRCDRSVASCASWCPPAQAHRARAALALILAALVGVASFTVVLASPKPAAAEDPPIPDGVEDWLHLTHPDYALAGWASLVPKEASGVCTEGPVGCTRTARWVELGPPAPTYAGPSDGSLGACMLFIWPSDGGFFPEGGNFGGVSPTHFALGPEGEVPENLPFVLPSLSHKRMQLGGGPYFITYTSLDSAATVQERMDQYDAALAELQSKSWLVLYREEGNLCGGGGPIGPGPEAVCAVRPSATVPGVVEFDATDSVDNVGDGLVTEWDFGDGSTIAPPAPPLTNHTYTLPGSYTATVTVTDVNGSSDSAECPVEIDAPQLGVGLSFPGAASALFSPGDTVPVRVTLSATEGVGDLTNVSFVGDPLDVVPDAALTPVSEPDPGDLPGPDGLTLAPGEEVSFDYEFEAAQPGAFSVRSSATGMDAAGRPIGPVENERNGRVGALDVEVTVDPDTVDLEEKPDQSGPQPEPATVTVTVTNPFADPVDVTLDAFEPQLVTEVAPPPGYQAFSYSELDENDNEVPTDPPTSVDVGTIPGAVEGQPPPSVTQEFTGLALDAGTVDLRVQANGLIAQDGAPPLAVSGGDTGRIEIAEGTELFFDAEIDEGTVEQRVAPGGGFEPWVDGGESWEIHGTLENRTLDKTIEVTVVPGLEGNASYGIPIPEGSTPPDEECGIGVRRVLAPGEQIDFVAPVHTILDGGTRGTVTYAPEAYELDGEDRTALTADQILVATGADEHVVRVDTRDRPPENFATPSEVLYRFGASFLDSATQWAKSLVQLTTLPLQLADTIAGFPEKWDEYVLTVWANLDDAEREQFLTSLAETMVSDLGYGIAQARDHVNDAVFAWFNEMLRSFREGDLAAQAALAGGIAGQFPDVVLARAVGVCRLIGTTGRALWAERALARAETTLAQDGDALVGAAARDLPDGAPLDYETHGRGIFGIDREMNRKAQEFVDETGTILVVRRRGVEALPKIEDGTHYPKEFYVKAKNGSPTDVDRLGVPAENIDEVIIKQPPPLSEVEASLAGADADTRALVLARWKKRHEEWWGKGADPETGAGGDIAKSERAKWLTDYKVNGLPIHKKSGTLDWRTNVEEGRAVPPDAFDHFYERVPFDPILTEGTDGRPMYIARWDAGEGLKRGTGDMDAMAVIQADFSPLPEAARLEVYERMEEIGFKHVESASWNDPAGRNGYLQEFSTNNPDSEAMWAWIPHDTPRAVRYDPQASYLDPVDALNSGWLYLRGANVQLRSEPTSLDVDLSEPAPVARPDYLNPKTIFLVNPACDHSIDSIDGGGLTVGLRTVLRPAQEAATCDIVFDRGPDALILREGTDGTIESWTEDDGWAPYDFSITGEIPVLPQSVSTQGADAGATEVEIASQDDLHLVAGVDEWFAVGDKVVLDPGGPNEETAAIAGFGSLVFEQPLQHDHDPGEMISVVDPADTTNTGGGGGDGSGGGGGSGGGTGTPGGSGNQQAGAGNGTSPGASAPGTPAGTSAVAGEQVQAATGTETTGTETTGSLPFTGAGMLRFFAVLGIALLLLGTILAPHSRRSRRAAARPRAP